MNLMPRAILASQNQHKCAEFGELLPNWQLQVAPPFYCEETAVTYWGNALLKARTVQKTQLDHWVLADDSGMEIAALQNRPGIFSARYGGPKFSAAERNALLLEELGDTKERGARFVCCLVLLAPTRAGLPAGPHKELGNQFYVAQSHVNGRIAHAPRSLQANAFGYDPIFELAQQHRELVGKTMAELSAQQKNRLSHRGLACAKLSSLLAAQASRGLGSSKS